MRLCGWLFGLSGVVLLAGCASDSDPYLRDDFTSNAVMTSNVTSIAVGAPVSQSGLWLVVVDDANTDVAQALRKQVAAAVALPYGYPRIGTSICAGDEYDPALKNLVDIRAAVAEPSMDGELRLVTPNEDATLARVGERDDVPAYEAWRTALRDNILHAPLNDAATPNARYSPLQVIQSFVSLMVGKRAPTSAREAQQLQSLAPTPPSFVSVAFTTTRDDESPGLVSDYDVGSFTIENGPMRYFTEVRMAGSQNAGETLLSPVCQGNNQPFPRLGEFLRLERSSYSTNWSADIEGLFQPSLASKLGMPPSFARKPERSSDGTVNCRVHISAPSLTECSPLLGRSDPLTKDGSARKPKVQMNGSGHLARVCEILQLDSDALVSCLNQDPHASVRAGWCYPEPSPVCLDINRGRYSISGFRLVGGSNRNTDYEARFTYTCSLVNE